MKRGGGSLGIFVKKEKAGHLIKCGEGEKELIL
jgi:hypothetical protein